MSTYRENVGDNGRAGDDPVAEEATASAPERAQDDGDKPVVGLDVCPHFALLEDPDTSLLFPSSMGHCHRAKPAAPVRLAHQERFCLTGRHRQCPVFRRPDDKAAPLPDKMRGRAAPAARRGRGWIRLLAAVAVAAIVLLGIGWGINLTSINGEEEPLPTRASVAILPVLGSETPTLPATSTPAATAAAAGETAVATASPTPSPAPTLTMTPSPAITGTAVATSAAALTPTRTLTPTLTTTPTVTVTTSTPTASATATTAPVTTTANVVVTVNRVNARTGPGLGYPVVTLIENGAEIPIVGQLNDGTWWQICCIEGREAPLWVFGETVDVEGDVAEVPVVPVPPLPTATPAP